MLAGGASRLCRSASLRCFSSSRSADACDVLIVGGGVVGSSVAYHLARARGSGNGIVVLERDRTYANASAVLSAGGIRQQFSLLENVQMSVYGIDFVKNAQNLLEVEGESGDDLQFHENGLGALRAPTPPLTHRARASQH